MTLTDISPNSYYKLYQHASGLTIVHCPDESPITYAGYAVHVGAKSDPQRYFGMAHLVEHMMFKGTLLRSSKGIIRRVEEIGADINAFTTKEETFVYAAFGHHYLGRMLHLLTDVVLHSRIPEGELEREKSVIIEEINSYKDSPSEQIFDEFEDILFASSSLGHNILGSSSSVTRITSQSARKFMNSYYRPDNMVLCFRGKVDISYVLDFCDHHFGTIAVAPTQRRPFMGNFAIGSPPKKSVISHRYDTHQTHCIIGGYAFPMHHELRIATSLLNNILGGPGMNSRLNMSLREEAGYVYSVESNYASFCEAGLFSIYFGCAHKDREKAQELVLSELKKLCDQPISSKELTAAKRQFMGQLAISEDVRETAFLSLGKSILFFGKYETQEQITALIDTITSEQLQYIAQQLYQPDNLLTLIYR